MVPLVACGLFALVPSRPDPGALSPAALPLGNADANANVSAFSVVVPCFSRQGSVHRVLSNLLANTTASEVILVMQSRAVVEDKEGILDRVQRAAEVWQIQAEAFRGKHAAARTRIFGRRRRPARRGRPPLTLTLTRCGPSPLRVVADQ